MDDMSRGSRGEVRLYSAPKFFISVSHDLKVPPAVWFCIRFCQRHTSEATELKPEVADIIVMMLRRCRHGRNPYHKPAEYAGYDILLRPTALRELAYPLPQRGVAPVARLVMRMLVVHVSTLPLLRDARFFLDHRCWISRQASAI